MERALTQMTFSMSKPMDISQNLPHRQEQCFQWVVNQLVLPTFWQEWAHAASGTIYIFYPPGIVM